MEAIRYFLINIFGGQTEWFVATVIAGIALAMVVSYYVTEGVLWVVSKIVGLTETTWDDDLLNGRFMRALSQLTPALVANWLIPAFFFRDIGTVHWVKVILQLYILATIAYIICILVRNLYDAMYKRERTKMYAVKGVFDMVQLVLVGAALIIGISLVWGRSPGAILTALGASAAVLMLVFKDTILGLVAGVQLTVNKMLHAGDWIIAEKHGINGEVVEVSLTTVKVKNWDNSISTVPPYALITESFRNYEPMRESGGRRVERSIFIDVNSVRFLDHETIQRLDKMGLLKGVKKEDVDHMVNLGLLRRYLDAWLSKHPDVNLKMLHMVRQMEPTQSGLPLQLYFFTKYTEWKKFEQVQSDIFDHVYAVINEFGLTIFQTPSGKDIH